MGETVSLPEAITSNAPPESGRLSTLLAALACLRPGSTIVEVGGIRGFKDAAIAADGWSTRVFLWWALRNDGTVWSIDPAKKVEKATRLACGEHPRLHTIRGDAEAVLADPPEGCVPDLLYMDGPANPAEWHGRLWSAMAHRPAVVLLDDILDCQTGSVKGLGVWEALSEEYRLVLCQDRQALWVAP